MEYKEMLELNSESPRRALLYQALMECEGAIAIYKEEFNKTKRRYWLGKIGNQTKYKKRIAQKFESVYGTKITNP